MFVECLEKKSPRVCRGTVHPRWRTQPMESCVKFFSTTKHFREQQQCCSNRFTIKTGFKQLGTIRRLFIPFSSASELNMLAHTPTLRLLLRKVNCMFIYLGTCPAAFFLFSAPPFVTTLFRNFKYSVNQCLLVLFIYLFIGWLAGQEEGKSTNIE